MIIGYARGRKNEQNLDLQIDSFLKEGIENKNIYTDKVSSTKEKGENLSQLLDYVREGDTIVV
jgi:DNA invertase Pin-like site-specific DNA recombinase